MDRFQKVHGARRRRGLGYKGPDIYVQNLITKRTAAIRKRLRRARPAGHLRRSRSDGGRRLYPRVAKELGRAYPELGDEFALTAIELSFLSERRQKNLAYRVDLDPVRGGSPP
jgi:tight adherence protein C